MPRATILLFLACAAVPASAELRIELPEGPGRDLVYGQCQTCHDLQLVKDSAGITHGAWGAVLDNMRNFGLRISADQLARILDYLAAYLGPHPPEAGSASTTAEGTANGARVFSDICSACHGPDGGGEDSKFPPLAENRDLVLSARFPALVVLNGMRGSIEVNGTSFDNAMPSFNFLSNAEIAAVVNYVRGQWGNDALAPSSLDRLPPADIGEERQKSMTAEDVHALRKSLLPQAGGVLSAAKSGIGLVFALLRPRREPT